MSIRFFLFLPFIVVVQLVSAQDVKFSGYGATGVVFYDRDILSEYNQETYYAGKLQADIKFRDEIEAQLDIRGNSTDNSMNFREFSVKFEYTEKLCFKIGNIKRPFGYEQIMKRDELVTVDRSVAQNSITNLGYGGRSVSIMAYYNYSEKRPDFPFSYFASIFKDNALTTGAALRGMYFFDDDYAFGASYMFQNRGGWRNINAHGLGLDLLTQKKKIFALLELFYVQDPVRGLQILEQEKSREEAGLPPLNDDEFIYTAGAKVITAIEFEIDGDVIKKIEPVVLIGYYQPDVNIGGRHVVQTVIGSNLYFHNKVRARLNGDIRLTRNQFSTEYTTDESRVIFELQVRF
jgi:hypothetical protein